MTAQGWRTMDSAPMDGRSLLVANFGEESCEARWHDGSENYWNVAGWYFVDDDLLTGHPCMPDVWRPMPVAPKAGDFN